MHLAQLEPGPYTYRRTSTSHEPQPSPQPFALPVHALDPSGIVIVVRNVDPRQLMGDNFSQSRRVPKFIASRIGQASARGRCACHRQQRALPHRDAANVDQTAGCDAEQELRCRARASQRSRCISGNELTTELDSVIRYYRGVPARESFYL
jgi:hypothetical protein